MNQTIRVIIATILVALNFINLASAENQKFNLRLKNDENFNYVLMCNKICGAAHYNMKMKFIVATYLFCLFGLALSMRTFNCDRAGVILLGGGRAGVVSDYFPGFLKNHLDAPWGLLALICVDSGRRSSMTPHSPLLRPNWPSLTRPGLCWLRVLFRTFRAVYKDLQRDPETCSERSERSEQRSEPTQLKRTLQGPYKELTNPSKFP